MKGHTSWASCYYWALEIWRCTPGYNIMRWKTSTLGEHSMSVAHGTLFPKWHILTNILYLLTWHQLKSFRWQQLMSPKLSHIRWHQIMSDDISSCLITSIHVTYVTSSLVLLPAAANSTNIFLINNIFHMALANLAFQAKSIAAAS